MIVPSLADFSSSQNEFLGIHQDYCQNLTSDSDASWQFDVNSCRPNVNCSDPSPSAV
jgi:hypothetical protein